MNFGSLGHMSRMRNLLFTSSSPFQFRACATQMLRNSQQKIARRCRIHRDFTKFIPPAVCHLQSSRFVAAIMAASQNRARTGTRLASSQTQVFPASVSFGRPWAANITSSITSAAESLTAFTCWSRNSRRMTRNRKWFGVPLEVRSKITRRFSTHCETGSCMTV